MQTWIIAGTGIPHTVAQRFYAPLAAGHSEARIIGLPMLGFGGMQGCCDEIATAMEDELGQGQRIHLIGHSQGGLIAAYLACLFPRDVVQAEAISAPFGGTPVAGLTKFVPAAADMVAGSPFLVHLRQTIVMFLKNGGSALHSIWPAPVHFSPLPGDGVLWQTRTSYLVGARNTLIAPLSTHARLRAKLPIDIQLVDGQANHFSEISRLCVRDLVCDKAA